MPLVGHQELTGASLIPSRTRRVFLIGLALLVASPCFGQSPSPFQSIPAPAPVAKPRPARPPASQEYIPPATAQPAPPVAQTPPPAPSLAGRWTGYLNCSFGGGGGGLKLNAVTTAPDQYTVTGTQGSYTVSGSIVGKQVRLQQTVLFKDFFYEGLVTSPVSMSGTAPGVFGVTCTWAANKS
jgi:hypothetical protein